MIGILQIRHTQRSMFVLSLMDDGKVVLLNAAKTRGEEV